MLTHGNGRYGYYKNLVFRSNIVKCKHFFQRPNFGNLGLLVGLEASRPTYWGVWGAEPPRKKGSYILHVSVDPRSCILEPESWIPDSGSSILYPGSWIWKLAARKLLSEKQCPRKNRQRKGV